jgi:hypothetical protein
VSFLEDRGWWAELERLCKLLKPFEQVITAVQSDTSNLADLTRYWIYLAAAMEPVLSSLPEQFARHVV